MDEKLFSQALEAIYDAASDPQHWPRVLDRLAAVFQAHIISMTERNIRTMEVQGLTFGADQAIAREYVTTWRDRNVWANTIKNRRLGDIATDEMILPKSDLLRSDYYNDFLRRIDVYSVMRLSLQSDSAAHHSISIARPRASEEFDAADIELGQLFLPHLRRAANAERNLRQMKAMLDVASEVLDTNPTGILFFERNGRVSFANRAAREMAASSDGLVLRQSCLFALRKQDDDQMQHLIAAATGRDDRPAAPRSGAVRISRKSGARSYVVMIAPLARRSSPSVVAAPVAFALLTDPSATPSRSPSMVREIFGLSASEGRMADRLAKGDTPEQAAAALRITIATARGYLAALFRKTETNRQSDLMRVLLSLPWFDGRDGG